VSHYGPMYETEDVGGWSGRQIVEWLAAHPGWLDAELKSCGCGICGDVIELVRLKSA
jgi:hypothetical protein